MRVTGVTVFFFSSRRRHTRYWRDWSSDVCSSDLQVFTCTIDPRDAKDFDDALSIRLLDAQGHPLTPQAAKQGKAALYEVGVHIADVSHYVTEGSIIDKEAVKRATSIYLVDRTIPMLPEHLCNFVCSLRPNEEKLAYSVIFTMDADADIKSSRIVHTVRSEERRVGK